MVTFVAVDKSDPSETRSGARGREIARCGGDGGFTPLRGDTSSAPFGGTFPSRGRLEGAPLSNTDPSRGRLLGCGMQHREHPGGKLEGAAGVQRKFTVFLQNLKVELRKASML